MILFYTGLTKPLVEWLFKYVPKKIVCEEFKLDGHLLLILVKIEKRANQPGSCISFWSGIRTKLAESYSTNLIYWPEKMALRKNLLKVFRGKL